MSNDKEVVTAGVCKLVTDATYAKIDAQKQIVDLEIKGIKEEIRNLRNGIKNQIILTMTVATVFIMGLELIIAVLHL